MQSVKIGNVFFDVDTTKTRVILCRGREKVGRAGVKDPKDFDFDVLTKLAAQGYKERERSEERSGKHKKNAKQEMIELLSALKRA